jgi:hypothetical protein
MRGSMKILRAKDTISVKSGDVEVKLSPLTQIQKQEIMALATRSGGQVTTDLQAQAVKTIKFCVKEVSGLETYDGQPYALEIENGLLTDECAGELFSAFAQASVLESVANLALGVVSAPEGVELRINGEVVSPKK